MSSKSIREIAKDNQRYLTTLTNSNPKTINGIINRNDSFAAVYAISSRYDDTILYVGQTQNIAERMKKHLSLTTKFGKQIKVLDSELKWFQIRNRHMANERQRKLFESYAIGVLKPKYNF